MRQAAKLSSLVGVLPGQPKVLEIEPCILVLDKIQVDRAVTYDREDLGTVVNQDGSEDAEWKTTRHYKNRDETKEAESLYNKVRAKLQSVCAKTDIGFVCPESRSAELAKVVLECKELVGAANQRFQHCHVGFRVVCTELKPTNVEGSLTLRDAIVEQTNEIKAALEKFDAKKAKNLLRSAKNFTGVLADPATRASLQSIHQEATDLANEIARAVKDYGAVVAAAASPEGQKILHRTKAPWQIF